MNFSYASLLGVVYFASDDQRAKSVAHYCILYLILNSIRSACGTLLFVAVLRAALKSQYGLDLPNVMAKGVGDFGDVTTMAGFICNKSAHWFAIRMINGRFWNLNSTEERPKTISHFKLATEIAGFQNDGCKYLFACFSGLGKQSLPFFALFMCLRGSLNSFPSQPQLLIPKRYLRYRFLCPRGIAPALHDESSERKGPTSVLVERGRPCQGEGERRCDGCDRYVEYRRIW